MKKLLISPYFGKLPNYFQLFLDSCALNADFTDFLIISDDVTGYKIPSNVKFLSMSFEDFNTLVKKQLGEDCSITSPYKICDYRPAFGKIFEDHLNGYDFWGHVDTDMVLGRLSNFISEDAFRDHDRILERGALMFYKNIEDINMLFRKNTKEIINFKEAITIREPCFYDEIMFPSLLRSAGYKTYSNTNYADILPQSLKFTIDSHCSLKNKINQYFTYKTGKGLFQGSWLDDDMIECMYIHIQKRPMKIEVSLEAIPSDVYVQENQFVENACDVNISNLDSYKWKLKYMRRQLKKLDLLHVKIHLKTRLVRRRIEW